MGQPLKIPVKGSPIVGRTLRSIYGNTFSLEEEIPELLTDSQVLANGLTEW